MAESLLFTESGLFLVRMNQGSRKIRDFLALPEGLRNVHYPFLVSAGYQCPDIYLCGQY